MSKLERYVVNRVVSYYARPQEYVTGGVNKSRAEWQEAIADRGTPVLAVDASGGYESSDIVGPHVTRVSLPHRGNKRVTMWPIGFGSLLREGDMVLLHEGWTLSNYAAATVCRRRSIPYLIMPHGAYDFQVLEGRLKLRSLREFLERRVVHHAHGVWLFFDGEGPDVRRFAPRARLFSAVTGFEAPTPRRMIAGSNGRTYVGWLGRFDIKHKGLDLLVGAVSGMSPASRPFVRLVGPDYAGDKDRLRAMVSAAGLDEYFSIEEPLSGAALEAFILQASLIVHPARWEAFGRSIVEVMALGTPIAVSSASQISAVLPDDGVVKFDCTVESLREVLGNVPSGSQRERMVQASEHWVRDYLSWDVCVDRFWAGVSGLKLERGGSA
ncbi:glycosyltransferase [Rhodococcus sp. NPDC003994]